MKVFSKANLWSVDWTIGDVHRVLKWKTGSCTGGRKNQMTPMDRSWNALKSITCKAHLGTFKCPCGYAFISLILNIAWFFNHQPRVDPLWIDFFPFFGTVAESPKITWWISQSKSTSESAALAGHRILVLQTNWWKTNFPSPEICWMNIPSLRCCGWLQYRFPVGRW